MFKRLTNKEIAGEIEFLAQYAPEVFYPDDTTVILVDGLKLTCKNSRQAMLAMAKKFKDNKKIGTYTRPPKLPSLIQAKTETLIKKYLKTDPDLAAQFKNQADY